MKTVGIVCEAFNSKLSGGRAAVAVAKSLHRLGLRVAIYVSNPNTYVDPTLHDEFKICGTKPQNKLFSFVVNNTFFQPPIQQHLNKAARLHATFTGKTNYIEWLEDNKIQVVHFASYHIDKPPFMINEAGKRVIPVVLQPWVHSYACFQGFGYRNGSSCTECFSGNFSQASAHGCSNGISSILGAKLRAHLREASLKYGKFLATCHDMKKMLVYYGACESDICIVPLPYEVQHTTIKSESPTENYFIYYSAIKDYKGVGVLKYLLTHKPHIQITILPMPGQAEALKQHGLTEHNFKNLRVVPNLVWGDEIRNLIQQARGILIPSLWPTSGEYVLLEAMALGKASCVFDLGMHKDYLIDGHNSMLSPPGDWEDFIHKVEKLHTQPHMAQKLGKNANATLHKIWDAPNWDAKLQSAYKTLNVI